MTAGHLDDDLLIALALDDLDAGDRALALRHLSGCDACHSGYDEIRIAVEALLPAVPALEPGPGFDERVLAAMGMSPTTAPLPPATGSPGTSAAARLPRPARDRRAGWRWLPAAAALGVGLALGAGGTWLATSDDAQVTTTGTALVDRSGAVVGEVSNASAAGDPVLVVAVTDAPDGARYTCRVTLTDASVLDVGTWTLPDGEGSWVVDDVDPAQVTEVEMVLDDGAVWASADLS